jgi:hypothetical protein
MASWVTVTDLEIRRISKVMVMMVRGHRRRIPRWSGWSADILDAFGDVLGKLDIHDGVYNGLSRYRVHAYSLPV